VPVATAGTCKTFQEVISCPCPAFPRQAVYAHKGTDLRDPVSQMAYRTKVYEIQAYKLIYLEQARLPVARREVDSALKFKTARKLSNLEKQEMKQIRPATSVI
jgi:hypothetical protein